MSKVLTSPAWRPSGGFEILEHRPPPITNGKSAPCRLELDAVPATGEIDHHAVAFLGGTLGPRRWCAACAGRRGSVDFGVGDLELRALDFLGATSPITISVDLEDGGEFQGVGAGASFGSMLG